MTERKRVIVDRVGERFAVRRVRIEREIFENENVPFDRTVGFRVPDDRVDFAEVGFRIGEDVGDRVVLFVNVGFDAVTGHTRQRREGVNVRNLSFGGVRSGETVRAVFADRIIPNDRNRADFAVGRRNDHTGVITFIVFVIEAVRVVGREAPKGEPFFFRLLRQGVRRVAGDRREANLDADRGAVREVFGLNPVERRHNIGREDFAAVLGIIAPASGRGGEEVAGSRLGADLRPTFLALRHILGGTVHEPSETVKERRLVVRERVGKVIEHLVFRFDVGIRVDGFGRRAPTGVGQHIRESRGPAHFAVFGNVLKNVFNAVVGVEFGRNGNGDIGRGGGRGVVRDRRVRNEVADGRLERFRLRDERRFFEGSV